jgi:hypothetical protein
MNLAQNLQEVVPMRLLLVEDDLKLAQILWVLTLL